MGKRTNKSKKNTNSKKRNGRDESSAVKKPYSNKELHQIIKDIGHEEGVRILAELNMQSIASGNTLDIDSLKKNLKTKYGVKLTKVAIPKEELNYPIEEIEKRSVKNA